MKKWQTGNLMIATIATVFLIIIMIVAIITPTQQKDPYGRAGVFSDLGHMLAKTVVTENRSAKHTVNVIEVSTVTKGINDIDSDIETCIESIEEQVDTISESSKSDPYIIRLLAQLVMAEAEDEPYEGKKLVVDTVLNRVDSEWFPNTISEVVYQKNQYECIWNGRFEKVSDIVTDSCVRAAEEELNNRSNTDVIFFRTKRFSDYGTPLFQVGRHYFSAE